MVHHAREAIEQSNCKTFGKTSTSTAFGLTLNTQYQCHNDDDLLHSTVVVLKKGDVYTPNDGVVAYFCFPRLGIAVPMCPGDAIVFNAQELHCLSLRCKESDDIYGIGIYTKSMVVGGNDNIARVNVVDKYLSGLYENGQKSVRVKRREK